MNIFFLDRTPIICAQYHCDKHVVKMITEYNQLMCTTRLLNGESAPYKATHKNHPCRLWLYNKNHYDWLWQLNYYLCREYTYRYGKIHKGQDVLTQIESANLSSESWQDPPLAMPDEFKQKDSVASYRDYYRRGKAHLHKWTNRNKPMWCM